MTTTAKTDGSAGSGGIVLDVRTGKRFPLELPITIHDRGSARKQQGTTFNVSASGVYVRAAKNLKIGSHVSFEILLPGKVLGTEHDVRIRCAGRVVRSDPSRGAGKRIEASREKMRGMACVIDQYRFIAK
jgi:hypothetical protein